MANTEKWHNTRKTRLDNLFSGRKFEVVEKFRNEDPQTTPLGYKVNSGYRLKDTETNEVIVVGKSLLDILAENYDAVEKPAPAKRGRPRKQPIEQAEVWAGREIPNDAQQITQPGEPLINPNADESF